MISKISDYNFCGNSNGTFALVAIKTIYCLNINKLITLSKGEFWVLLCYQHSLYAINIHYMLNRVIGQHKVQAGLHLFTSSTNGTLNLSIIIATTDNVLVSHQTQWHLVVLGLLNPSKTSQKHWHSKSQRSDTRFTGDIINMYVSFVDSIIWISVHS